MLPTAGVRVQVTAVFELFAIEAAKLWDWDWPRPTDVGVTETLTGGVSDIVAVAVLVESATLVAVTVMVWAAEMVAGAV
jgi:hypothetical protein